MKKNITLFLMTQKGYEVLIALIENYVELISGVIGARDLKIEKDYYEEIKLCCDKHGIPFYDRNDKFVVDENFAFAVSWRWLINIPSSKLIVFHDSLLPKYRGFNPLVSALINAETKIGVTALFATKEYDRGNIIAQSATNISYPIKIQDAINIITDNYRKLALLLAEKISHGETPKGVIQNEADGSYSLWRDEEDYRIDWSKSSGYIKRFIDSVGTPYKSASALINDKLARILDAEIIEDVKIENRTIGKVIFTIGSKPVVVCGSGLLKIIECVDDTTKASILPLSKFRSRFR